MTDQSVLPEVDESRITAIFNELGQMEVELDPDPLAYGPKRLNKKVARARGMLTRCERVFLQVSHDLQLYKRSHRVSELDFNLQMQDLYANDPEVRAGRNVRDREALATMKLREQREEIMGLEIGIQDLEMVMSVVKAKRADLRDIQNRLKDQMKLCQEEIGLGTQWGSKPPPGIDGPDLSRSPKTDQQALANLQALVVETGGSDAAETHLSEDDPSWMEESDDADVDDLFDEMAAEGDEEEDEGEDSDDDDDLDGEDFEDEGDIELSPEMEDEVEAKIEQAEADLSEIGGTASRSRVREPDLTSYPKVGYCSVCGQPQYKTSSGPVCANGHGGATTLAKPPKPPADEADIDDILNEVTAEPEAPAEPDPEPEPEPTIEMVDIFDGGGPSRDDTVPEVSSDDDIDDFFQQLDAKPAKTKTGTKPSPNLADEDLDSLIDLFGA